MTPINGSIENLVEGVMVDILLRLPVTTVVHCKCVCKKWHNLVNSSYFINLHLSRSPVGFMVYHDQHILDGATSGILKWVEIEDGLDHHSLHHEPLLNFDLGGCLAAHVHSNIFIPVGSVNGLICIWKRFAGNMYICNPITREYLTLHRQQSHRDGYVLIIYNFGINSLTREYKVLRFFRGGLPPYPPTLEAEVYTLGTSEWRSLGQVPYRIGGGRGPFLNSYFHWEVYQEDAPGSILTFDLDKETFQLFPSPPSEPGAMQENTGNLGVFNGCLCRLGTYDFHLTIWVMKQYGIKESWHKELVITQAICASQDWELKKTMFVFGGLQDGTILVVVGCKMLAYCPKSNTFEDLSLLDNWFVVMTHRPSFIKLKEIDSERVGLGMFFYDLHRTALGARVIGYRGLGVLGDRGRVMSDSICQKFMPPINPSIENLLEEVMVDILSRLPVKTIIHCKCVCKKWRNLVNSSYFINLHFSRSPEGFMFHHDPLDDDTFGILKWVEIEDGLDHHSLHLEPVVNFDLDGCLAAHVPPLELKPVRSVNGLIFISQHFVSNNYICNPITREYLTLPKVENYKESYGHILLYNFGVNSVTGEYKVLRLFRGDLPPYPPILGIPSLSPFDARIYTLGTSQWRSLGQVPYRIGGFREAFLNSYFHWRVDGQDAPESICTFDLDKETFQLFPSPPTQPGAIQESTGNLGVLKGCLCRLDTYDFQLTMWVMKQYGIKESWHKELVITEAICDSLDWEWKNDMFVFGGLQDGTILVVVGFKMLAYCPKTKTFEDLSLLDNWYVVISHRPSFIKLKDIDSERVHTF
ncbi:hypothetical protein OSB04_015984 [Centaurea solstitialis]|uniref:F-box domain-containing protein n=1 Tax=Centaurea solstitialis TaxID=347529 RepID=A0AA38T024_9ASTR|nr:hypothetical protein OSB04_015984 [Centaurea solstitialis]